ncbi:choice-of-anchor L domain-containing protein [Chitinophagaceae bacterium MMS25-I14]
MGISIPKMMKNAFAVGMLCMLGGSIRSDAQINVYPNQTALALAQTLTGAGVVVSNATLTCPNGANAIFGTVTSPLVLDSGIILTSGMTQTNGAVIGVNGNFNLFANNNNNAAGDADLTTLSGQPTNDACKLEFDFVPAGDTIKFDYVFGSEEYNGQNNGFNANFNCSTFDDAFGFFISGPGITGVQNIALVPGTTLPVSINTINDGVGAVAGGPCFTNTNGNGPYTQYYVSNSGQANPDLTYSGRTVVLTAIKNVTPCSTYHLKLAVADAVDFAYDSGVFLKAGSLTSNAVAITPIGGGGLTAPTPYCVRGCLPGRFVFARPVPKPTPLTIHYQIQGSAVNGSDYTTIADSVVIPANGTTANQFINALPVTPATGPKTVKLLVYSPYTCGTSTPIIDSAIMTIYDSLQANIITPDTAICRLQSVKIITDGDTLLHFHWTPATGLDDPNAREPIATPSVTTTYTLNGYLPGSGCDTVHKQITITIKQPPVVNAGPDRTTCLGTPFQFNVVTTPATQTYTYSWTPGNNLSSTTVSDPVFTPTAVTGNITYYITANPGAVGCSGYDTISVRVLPNDFNLYTRDTAICKGATVTVNADGDTAFHYTWTPTAGVSDPNIITPSITPDTSRLYTITASYPTCPDIVKQFFIDVQPNPVVYAGPDRAKCQWDTLHIEPVVTPDWYTHYSYSWSPATHVDDPTSKDIVFDGQKDTTLVLTVTTPAGCTGNDDMNITVHQGNFASVAPADTAICPLNSVPILVTGGAQYHWTPATYLDDPNIANPVSSPIADVYYTGLITDIYGCKDTVNVNIVVHPNAVVSLPDTITLWPGQSAQMDPQGNCLYFQWFPSLGLSASNISNPVVMPQTNTKYIVTATTENGCTTEDSVIVKVNEETILALPNAFSPGSQPNSILKINKLGIASLKYFRIFNRWGTKVFETSDIDQGWDGQYNGTPQPMGVYVYEIEAYTNTGKRFYKQGNVTLIR